MSFSSTNQAETTIDRPRQTLSTRKVWLLFAALFAAIYFASLFTPPLLDDVDAAHAQAAQYISDTGDWVSPHINNIRYIEKPPLPYWMVAALYRVTGVENSFTTHLPNALAILALAWICWLWARKAWGDRAGLYAGLAVLTSVGPFLFTRFIIPESMLAFFMVAALYCLITGLDENRSRLIYCTWACVALALLTKGLIAPVFFIGAAIPYLLLTGQWRRWRALKPVSGFLLFLAVAAPWHILCGLANPDQGHPIGNHPTIGNVHGFFYFYFINEHVLRFFSLRYPHDYNKLPALWYWVLHLVWLFPWSLFLPAAVVVAFKTRKRWMRYVRISDAANGDATRLQFRARSVWLLALFSAWTLFFFSLSSNQEYYTFPVWPALFILIAGVLAEVEERGGSTQISGKWLSGAQAVFAVVGVLAAVALGWGLWTSRNLPFVPDIGTVLAHRGVGDYTLSMSHLFDLTGESFAALRLPAGLAAIALLLGPAAGWLLRVRGRHLASTISVAVTMMFFLIAAHIAFARFEPMLSSKIAADTIMTKGTPNDTVIIYGEQSSGSSVIFYTHNFFRWRPVLLVGPRCGQHGEGTTLLWGSCYPDAPNIFLSDAQLQAMWGTGERKWLFAEDPDTAKAEKALGSRLYLVQTIADKELWTDRPF